MLRYKCFSAGDAVRWIAFAHGVFGSGGNWRSFARKLSERSGWGAVTVDLRMHGESQNFAGPHTIEAAAADVAALIETLGHQGKPVEALSGHSFGGKVFTLARQKLEGVRHFWLVDSSPSARPAMMDRTDPTAAAAVLQTLETAGERFADREAFVDALIGRAIPGPVARWLALNLERDGDGDGDGVRFALDLGAIRSLLADYFATDSWAEIESGPIVDVAIAGRDSAFDRDDLDRLDDLEARGQVRCHRFADAGHLIHVDAPAALLDAMVRGLAETRA